MRAARRSELIAISPPPRCRRRRAARRRGRAGRGTPASASSRACADAGRSTSMTSLIRPGRGLITATWSERKIASEMPWVTISVVAGFSVQIRSSSRLSRCRVMSSSAPNGSSSSSTDGLTTSDRAIETRWRMPPESWAGLAFSKPSSPTSLISSLDQGLVGLGARDLERQPDVGLAPSARGAGRSPGRRCRARGRGAARAGSCRRRCAVPLVAVSRPARIRRIVDLPQPEGPSSDRKRALVGVQGGVLEGHHLRAADREGLAEVLDVEPGAGAGARPAPASGCRHGASRVIGRTSALEVRVLLRRAR